MEKVSFIEAVRALAERSSIPVKEEGGGEESGGFDKEKLYRANEWAATIYEKCLWEDPRGAPAREYLERRGLKEEVCKRFRLGFAPPSRDTLLRALGRRSKAAVQVLDRSGLVLGTDRGEPYDRFRGRLMFPIMDVRGRVIAFGGRTLGDDTPKYLNSPETPIFSKGISLYGVSFAKSAAHKTREIFVMEGYTDVLAAFQCGVETAVATLGTALSAGHVRNLRRYADRIYLVYDADFAGEKASDRGLDIFLEEEVDAAIMSLPEGEDPCDFFLKRGAGPFLALKEEAKEIFDYKVALATRRHDLKTVAGQTKALEEILATAAKVPTLVRRELQLAKATVLRDLAESLGVSEAALRERMRGLRTGRAEAPATKKEIKLPSEEKWLLETVLAEPRLVEAAAERVSPEDLRSPELAAILKAVYETNERLGEARLSSVVTAAGELSSLVVSLAEGGTGRENHEQRLADCIARIDERKKRETRARLKRSLVEGADDPEKQDKILREYQKGL
jgi:DNA primase